MSCRRACGAGQGIPKPVGSGWGMHGNILVLISCLSLPVLVRKFEKVSAVCDPGTWVHHDLRQEGASNPSLRAVFPHSLSSMRLHPQPALPFASPRPAYAQTSVKNDTGGLSKATSHSHPAPSCENPFLGTALTEPGSVCTPASRPLLVYMLSLGTSV